MMKLLKLVAIFSVLISFINAKEKKFYEIENELKRSILDSYNKSIRPDKTVHVIIAISLFKIIHLDEINEIMQSSAYLYAIWIDVRLKWEPSEHNNISEMFMPITELWKPDLYVINSADSVGSVKFSGMIVKVKSDGTVSATVELPGRLEI